MTSPRIPVHSGNSQATIRYVKNLEEGVLVFGSGASSRRIKSAKKPIAWLQMQHLPAEGLFYKYQELSAPDGKLKVSPPGLPLLGFVRKVHFIEYHMDLFTRDYFACLQDIVTSGMTDGQITTDNHLGWFVDYIMPRVCGGKLGVIDAMKMLKSAGLSYSGAAAVQEGHAWADTNNWKLEHDLTETLGPLKGNEQRVVV